MPALVYSRGLRARKLTGIQHAYHSGDLGDEPLGERRYETGQRYGECFEIVMGLTSSRGEGGGSAGFGAGPQLRIFEAGQDYADYIAGITARQRAALDLSAGRACGSDRPRRRCGQMRGRYGGCW